MLTKFALKRPVAILASLITLIFFGSTALLTTPLELMPSMSFPMLIITTAYPGAAPEEVDSLVSEIIEDVVSTTTGLKSLQSNSAENVSMVMMEFEYGTDMDQTNLDVQKKLNTIVNALPDDATDPTIMDIMADAGAVVQMSVLATGDIDILSYVKENIAPEFEKLNGVASVDIYGGDEKYLRVALDPNKLSQYNLNMDNIIQMIAVADFSFPAGYVSNGNLDLTLRGGVEYTSPQQLAKMPITLNSGDIIQLSDVAEVGYSVKDTGSSSWVNGQEVVSISVSKRDSADTTSLASDAIDLMNKINSENRGVRMGVSYNSADEIYASLNTMLQAMALSIVISMLVLFIFLGDFKASLVVGASMPVSLLVTLIMMSYTGMTFNTLTLGGLAIGVGMMVDNAIVVLDSCFKQADRKMTFKESALVGSKLVALSIIASTTTTVVVFLPIMFMEGISGQIFKETGYTIVYALLASLLSALTLIPLLFFKLKPVEKKDRAFTRGFEVLERAYKVVITKALNARVLVVLVGIISLIAGLSLIPHIDSELMPSSDIGQISISATTKPGLQLASINEISTQIEEAVYEMPEVEFLAITTRQSSTATNISMTVELCDRDLRTRETAEVVDALRVRVESIKDANINLSMGGGMESMGMAGSDSISVSLIGRDEDLLKIESDRLKEFILQQDGILSATTSLSDGTPQAEIIIDPVKASAYGLLPASIMTSINSMVSGKEATTIRMDGNDYSVMVGYQDNVFDTVRDLNSLTLTAPSGATVPLPDIATIVYSNAPKQVQKYDGDFVATVDAKTSISDAAAINARVTQAVNQFEFVDGVDFFWGGSMQMMMDEFAMIFQALITAVFLVFIVMVVQFNSFKFSLMVMISLPFSLFGSFFLLYITDSTINMTSMMGFIMLSGIVVNNAIVLIDYTNQLIEREYELKQALITASTTRLRPILMTTLTTVLGMLPMAVGTGENSEMMASMALVVIGGLSASTLLTLILLPTFYYIFTNKKYKHGFAICVETGEQLPPKTEEQIANEILAEYGQDELGDDPEKDKNIIDKSKEDKSSDDSKEDKSSDDSKEDKSKEDKSDNKSKDDKTSDKSKEDKSNSKKKNK